MRGYANIGDANIGRGLTLQKKNLIEWGVWLRFASLQCQALNVAY